MAPLLLLLFFSTSPSNLEARKWRKVSSLFSLFLLLLSLATLPAKSLASINTLNLFAQNGSSQARSSSTTTCAPLSRKAEQIAPNKLSKEVIREIASQLAGSSEKAPPINGNENDDSSLKVSRDYNGPKQQEQEVQQLGQEDEVKQQHKYKLPSWFNYELYKLFFGKSRALQIATKASDADHNDGQIGKTLLLSDNEIHKRIYLRTALRVFEQQALYRVGRTNIVSSINELSDLSNEEISALKTRKVDFLPPASGGSAKVPDCCTYEQLYTRIIDLLNKTSNGESPDLLLSRAMLDELEQKPLLVIGRQQEEQQLGGATRSAPSGASGQRKGPPNPTSAGQSKGLVTNSRLSLPGDNKTTLAPAKQQASPVIEGQGSPAHKSQSEAGQSARAANSKTPAAGAPPPAASASELAGKSLSRAYQDNIAKQLAEQFSGDSDFARQLRRHYSSMFGRPVVIRATVLEASSTTTSSPSRAPAS